MHRLAWCVALVAAVALGCTNGDGAQEADPPEDGARTMLDQADASADQATQSAVRNAVTAARTLAVDDGSYRDVTPERLKEAEPALDFLADGESTGSGVVSVLIAGDDVLIVAVRSDTGTCFAARDVLGGGTDFARSIGPCQAGSFDDDDFSPRGWD